MGEKGRRGRIGRMLSLKMQEKYAWREAKKGVEETMGGQGGNKRVVPITLGKVIPLHLQ